MSKPAEVKTDNTRVEKPQLIFPQKLTSEQIAPLLSRMTLQNQGRIYDTNKAKYYKAMQDFYNQNAFGYGMQGNPTNFDPTTPEGQKAIEANFQYAQNNAMNFLAEVSSPGVSTALKNTYRTFKGVFPKGNLGHLDRYIPLKIGEGSEAIVIKNTPFSVGKITQIPVEEMAVRNTVPNTVFSKFVGNVKTKGAELPAYIQRKVKVLTEDTFPKYINKLDNTMQKSGFKVVKDPNVQYRAYTDGTVVIDDIAPGNVGLNWLKQPKLIDFNIQSVPDWLAQGFTLKRGGKL